jgi:hypothetical protein
MGKKRTMKSRRLKRQQEYTTPPTRVSDLGTPELAMRETLIKERVSVQIERMRNVNNVWPLDRYAIRGRINDAQHHAGKRIYNDFERGGITRFCSNWPDPSRPIGSNGAGGLRLTEAQAQALSDFRNAYRSLNNEGAFMIWHIVCMGIDISVYEEASGWRTGWGMIRLREALDDLMSYYKTLAKKK